MKLEAFGKVSPGVAHTLRETPWWGWGILLVSIFVAVILGKLAQMALRSVGRRFVDRGWNARGLLFTSGAGAINLVVITMGLSFGLEWVVMTSDVTGIVHKILAFLYTLAIGWYIYNLIDLLHVFLHRVASRSDSKLDDAIVPLIKRTARIFVVVLFFLFIAQNIFGADISAWLTGLGVAGLAVSLAAQDSIKNLFGSITIYLDHTFGLGDRVVFDNNDGIVKEIGFRSTKLRLPDGTIVTIPNSKIVESSVRNVPLQASIARTLNLRLALDTPPEKIERAVDLIREILREPEIEKSLDKQTNPARVAFDDLSPDGLNLRVMYWFNSTDQIKYLDHAQEVNLRLMRALADEGIEFAIAGRRVISDRDLRIDAK